MATSSKKPTSTGSRRSLLRQCWHWLKLLELPVLIALAVSTFMLALDVGRLRASNRQLTQAVAVLRSNEQMFDSAIVAMARELGMMPDVP